MNLGDPANPARLPNLLDAGTNLYAMVGTVMTAVTDQPGELTMVVGPNHVTKYPAGFRPFIDFFGQLRTRAEAQDWIVETGGTSSTLDNLVAAEHLVEIPGTDVWSGLRNLYLEPYCTVVESDGPTTIRSAAEGRQGHVYPAGALVAAVLAARSGGKSLQRTIVEVAELAEVDARQAGDTVLVHLPALLAGQYAYLARVES